MDLPPIIRPSDIWGALDRVLQAVAGGKITPAEALAVVNLIEAKRKSFDYGVGDEYFLTDDD